MMMGQQFWKWGLAPLLCAAFTAWFATPAWAGITVSKSFSPATIAVGGSSVLTISIDNNPPPGGTGSISFTDTYPANLKNAATPAASSDCGGTVTAAAGGSSLSFSGGSVNGNNVCMVTVTVTSTVVGSYFNSTGLVTTTNAGNGTAATATLTVTATPPTVAKGFSPSMIAINGTSTLTITLTNPNAVPIVGVTFIDNYPANTKNTGAPGLTNTCGGTASAVANGTSLALSGGTIPAGGSCSLTVQVTATASGSYLNSTGAVTTTNVGTGTAATATLTVASASAAPSGFNAFETGTAAGSVSGVIRTKIASSAFSLAIVALKSSGTAVETVFAGDVKLELVDASAGAGCGAYALIRNLGALTFMAADLGRKTLAGISEPNAWSNARIRMTYPATGVPTLTACSTDNFAIRPASLAVSAHDNDWQSPGINRTLANMATSGGNVHKAGQPFTLHATGLNASNSPTGNYTGSPTLKTLACTLPAAPSTCINGILTPGVWSGSGTVTSSSASYSETGSFNLTLEDQTFANVDSADSTLLERTIPQAAAVPVGRFVPDHFELANVSVPQFKTFNDTTCATRTFTYIGQPFGYVVRPTATILAKDKDNNTLANYQGSLWKIGDLTGLTTPVVTKNCLTSPDPNTCVFTTFWDAASGSSVVTETYTYALMPASTPNWDDSGSTATAAGVDKNTGLISFIASDTLAFKRSNTTPQVLFTASITNVIAVKDMSEDGNCGVVNCDITTTTPAEFNNIGFDEGNEFRFGRLVLSNAHGSELLNLPVPIETQFWNVSGFARNTADFCTQFSDTDVSLSNWRRNLNAGDTSVSLSGRFDAGRGNLKLSKPGTGNTGSVDLALQLGAASQTWLRGRWTGGDYDQDPAARASFGLYRAGKPLIYLRELY